VLRRLAAALYESLLVAAILIGAGLAFFPATQGPLEGGTRIAFQVWLAVVLAAYFVGCWRRGQTLAMKAWHLRLTGLHGEPVSTARAALRFVLAAIPLGLAGAGILVLVRHRDFWPAWLALGPALVSIAWGCFDADGRFLYDVLSRTRVVHVSDAPPTTSSLPPSS
jgi:uncharacterized RDD family membrane protein YckC